MSNIDKQALREAAEKATPGPWRYLKSTPFMDAEVSAENHTRVVNLLAGDVTADNSEFIAAASPAAVLALLDDLEAKDKRIAELEARTVSIPDYTELYKGPFAMEVEHQVKRALAAAGIRIAAAAGKGE
ncbi:ead/Ea22-like family protein [Citrobacter farmeri]|uniref:ead/Ea22-like family protein n=1 Tax=Citrobacter farmeri TaxID=67824 RepID=UPI00192217BD|nr:ead/Ea22-like family protein [Citrobacter farmeri]MBJ8746018.1 ead/Ea22-like family protein [Citrobacter farmeri]MBJ8759269.1 ead/Ea22-like family protein [Citrobacter farmeri]